MSCFRTGDPLDDFEHHDRQRQKLLDKFPKCDRCRRPIQDEYLFDIYGDVYCEKCGTLLFRREVTFDE